MIKLKEHDHIVCAYAQRAAGPGWANAPLWVIIKDGNGNLRQECLQPEEQGERIIWMYDVAASIHSAMVAALNLLLKRPRRKAA